MTLAETAQAIVNANPRAKFASLGFVMTETKMVRPGLDFVDNHLYMTVPIMQDQTVTVGRGKGAHEETKTVLVTAVIRDDGVFHPYNEEAMAAEGFVFPTTFTQDTNPRWTKPSMTSHLFGEAPIINSASLFNDLRKVFVDHVEYPEEIYYDLLPLYILSTYVFRLFQTTPYIHFFGSKASGKSQNLNLIKTFGLNAIWASNMSSPALYRRVAGCPGVLCLDETEGFDGERGEELRRILNAGYVKGGTVPRAEKQGDTFVTIEFEAYCPKVMASITPLEPVLQSRSMIIPMSPAIRRIPNFNPEETRWQTLRDRIYLWAMQNAAALVPIRDTWTTDRQDREAVGLTNREWQLAHPLLTLGEHFGGAELIGRLLPYFATAAAAKAKAQEDADRQVLLLKILPRVLAKNAAHEGGYYAIKEIHATVTEYLEEDAREYYKTRAVSRHLVTLGFKDKRQAKGGAQIRLPEAFLREQFTKRHTTPFEEDEAWLRGEASYEYEEPTPPTPPVDDRLSWLDEYAENA